MFPFNISTGVTNFLILFFKYSNPSQKALIIPKLISLKALRKTFAKDSKTCSFISFGLKASRTEIYFFRFSFLRKSSKDFNCIF